MGQYTYGEFHVAVKAICVAHRCSVTSGIRTDQRSNLVGGAPRSRHKWKWGGKGVDLLPDENTEERREGVCKMARELDLVAIDEGDHVHVHDDP